MTEKAKLPPPSPETVKKHVENLRIVCLQLDALTMQLDELIAMVEADIRKSPLNVYRREKAKQLRESS